MWALTERACDRAVLAASIAHMALRQVDWSIRHRARDDVARWLARSRVLLDRFAA